MLTQIDVDSENAFLIPILGATPQDSLLVRTITGLNPPDIDLFIGDYSRDGGTYQGRRVGKRNIVITIDLNPNPALGETIAGLREMLYKAFVDPLVEADYIKLTFHDDEDRARYLVGYTEKFETEVFSIETMAQVSIICPDPYLRDEEETVLTDDDGWVTVPFAYAGTAETGFEVEVFTTGSTTALTLDNNNKTMVLSDSMVSGNVVYFNTIRGTRTIRMAPESVVTSSPYSDIADVTERWLGDDGLVANDETTSMIPYLTVDSPWIELHSQSNTLKTYGTNPADSNSVIKTLKYVQSYWGV